MARAQGWAWGDFYAFVDVVFRDDVGTEAYNENYVQMSLSWLAERPIALGPVTDVDRSGAFHVGSEPSEHPFRAMLAGVSLDIRIPGFRFAQFDVHACENDSVDAVGVQFTPVWDADFRVGRLPLRFRGFADVLGPGTNRGDRWHFLDLGALAGRTSGNLYFGVEYAYWHNTFGVKAVDESVAQAMLMFDF